MIKAYEVQKQTFDAVRPYAVVATFRSFNQVIARYEDEASAKRRARDMNRRHVMQSTASIMFLNATRHRRNEREHQSEAAARRAN
jgi:hypothetical protein